MILKNVMLACDYNLLRCTVYAVLLYSILTQRLLVAYNKTISKMKMTIALYWSSAYLYLIVNIMKHLHWSLSKLKVPWNSVIILFESIMKSMFSYDIFLHRWYFNCQKRTQLWKARSVEELLTVCYHCKHTSGWSNRSYPVFLRISIYLNDMKCRLAVTGRSCVHLSRWLSISPTLQFAWIVLRANLSYLT